MAFHLARQREMYRLNVARMHDVCAIVPYVHPDLIRFLHTSARIETDRDLVARHDGVRPAPPRGFG